jgi:hypothetical protein
MNTVLAGWAMGYAMAVASTVALVYLTVRLSTEGGPLDRWVSNEVPRPLLIVPIFVGVSVVWTAAGLVLAAIYEIGGLASRPNALGSPSWPFTVLVLALAIVPLPALVLFARRYWWLWCAMSLLFAGLFGWVMPVLAER